MERDFGVVWGRTIHAEKKIACVLQKQDKRLWSVCEEAQDVPYGGNVNVGRGN